MLTFRSGESAISPKLAPIAAAPGVNTIVLIAEGSVPRGVAVPLETPLTVPGVVTPSVVNGGWSGSVTV
ncbi:hypothetical protein D3C80_2237200 [compost metagenome]